jgi:Raf kinase inhibitor-like YbhB/YbcL family protein
VKVHATRFLTAFPVLAALSLTPCAIAWAQQPDPLTDFQITGHVYEPQPVPPTDERISRLGLPSGFQIARFAEGLYNPRMIAVAGDGTVYVTQRTPGNLVMLKDTDGDAVIDAQKVVLSIKDLHGIAIRGTRIYLVDVHKVYSGELRPDGRVDSLEVVTSGLPDAGQHPNRTLEFGPDGALYLSIGSTCNACPEPNPENATLVRVDLDSGKREIVASGLRNTIGFGWHPSGRLYGMDHGIDWLGNEHQKEELNEIVEKARYGWPYIYGDAKLNPQDEPLFVTQLEWAEMSRSPSAYYTAHAAPMQLAFYTGTAFPTEFRNDAFVAMRGSWNRKPASGYEVVRVRFDAAGSFVGWDRFVSGFLTAQPNTRPPLPGAQPKPPDGFIGRPTGVAIARDGSLLVGDDSNNMLYRINYGNATASLFPQQLASQIVHANSGATIRVTSSAFEPGAMIPEQYTDYGKGISPPLNWSAPPQGTRAVVLMMEDPDATSPLPFVHWTLVVPPGVTQLPAGVPTVERIPQASGASQGSNSRSTIGYFGPRPPAGEPPHAYHFQVFALDTRLELPSGYNRHALLKAMQGHVLAQGELVGTFARAP